MVLTTEPGLAALQVADGLDLARGDLHEHASAPLGIGLDAHLVEFILHDVLQLHIDGRGDVIALDSGHTFHRHNGVSELDVARDARFAIQQRIERTLQA